METRYSEFKDELIERLIQEFSKPRVIHNHGQSNQFYDSSTNTQNYFNESGCVEEAIVNANTRKEAAVKLEEFKKDKDFQENYDNINKYMRNEEETKVEICQITRCTDLDSLCAHVGMHMASLERLSLSILTSAAMIKTFEYFTRHSYEIDPSNFRKRVKRFFEETHPEYAKKITPRDNCKTAADNRGTYNPAVGNVAADKDRGDVGVK